MMGRCYNPRCYHYENYGGSGIGVCAGLKSTPRALFDLLGERPKSKFIDRINNGIGYSCGRCDECIAKSWPMNLRWATYTENNRNKRNNVFVTVEGQTRCVSEWAQVSGIHEETLRSRLKYGRNIFKDTELESIFKNS